MRFRKNSRVNAHFKYNVELRNVHDDCSPSLNKGWTGDEQIKHTRLWKPDFTNSVFWPMFAVDSSETEIPDTKLAEIQPSERRRIRKATGKISFGLHQTVPCYSFLHHRENESYHKTVVGNGFAFLTLLSFLIVFLSFLRISRRFTGRHEYGR